MMFQVTEMGRSGVGVGVGVVVSRDEFSVRGSPFGSQLHRFSFLKFRVVL